MHGLQKKKKALEMHGLLKRIQSGREEQKHARKTELERLVFKTLSASPNTGCLPGSAYNPLNREKRLSFIKYRAKPNEKAVAAVPQREDAVGVPTDDHPTAQRPGTGKSWLRLW